MPSSSGLLLPVRASTSTECRRSSSRPRSKSAGSRATPRNNFAKPATSASTCSSSSSCGRRRRDISVHNANVFYELGIRHALRAKHTVLIRAKVTKPRPERTAEDEVPFDLKTDRYLEYDHTAPAASVDELVKALTFAADARKDSPVFQSLPNLGEQDRTRFAPVPREFSEAVDSAQSRNDLPVLGLLAAEASGATWEVEGWRKVGKALFDLGATPAARRAWERIRTVEPYDVEANLRLATILQKAGAITESDQALDRVFANVAASRRDKAEGWALRGSNEKCGGQRPGKPLPPPPNANRSRSVRPSSRRRTAPTGPPSIST